MTLYLLRHGLAEPVQSGGDDRSRRLTAEGISRIERQAAALARSGLLVDRLFCSPYPRARETADIMGKSLGVAVEEDARLACGATVEGVIDLVEEQGGPGRVMVVGHQPDLGYITQALTGSVIAVREGSLIAINGPALYPHRCTLVGLYDPDVMVALGGRVTGA